VADLEEVFEYGFTRLDPVRGDHIDPPTLAVYETLLVKGPDGRPLPGLASSWIVSDDGSTWTLRLRDGARFHSGRVCDAAAVVDALELCRWGDGLARQVWYWDPVDTVVAVDERTVAFRLHHPCPRLPVLLWGTHTAVVNAETWRMLGDDFGTEVADGTGPYRLTAYSPDEVGVELIDRASPRPRTIRWRSVPDDAERARIALAAEADVVRSVPAGGSGAATGWTVQRQQENSQFYLAFSSADPRGFGDPVVRRCFDAFLDRDALLRTAMGGEGDARRSPVPASDEFADAYDPADVPPLSRDEARRELHARGWRAGADGILERDGLSLRVDTVAQDTEVCRRLADALSGQLRAAGVELRFTFAALFEPFYRAVEAGPAAFLNKWLWSDAMEAVYGFCRTDCIEPAGGNWQRSSCAVVDRAFDDFREAADPASLRAASAAVQRAFMRELPYLPLVSPVETLAVGPRVQGFGLVRRTLYPTYDDVLVAG
jgi:peptide/nickel transport system substrate-binding protein